VKAGLSLHIVELPKDAPAWASPLVGALLDAGFVPEGEARGGMAGYSLALGRNDCQVMLGGDRGDFDVWLGFSNPLRGRGHPRRVEMPAEDYLAAERGDVDAAFLLSDSPLRAQAVATWLTRRAGNAPLALDEELLQRIQTLQRQRAKAMFGSG
jgi:hypothetical protein